MEKKGKNILYFVFRSIFIRSGLLFLYGLLLFVFVSCKTDVKVNDNESKQKAFMPDKSFAPFYERFHNDSVYQLAHINFPLQGMPQRIDSVGLATQEFYWEKGAWTFQQDFDEKETGFSKTVNAVSPTMVEETIVDRSGQFGIVRRFVKIDGEWYLIYFSGLAQIKQ